MIPWGLFSTPRVSVDSKGLSRLTVDSPQFKARGRRAESWQVERRNVRGKGETARLVRLVTAHGSTRGYGCQYLPVTLSTAYSNLERDSNGDFPTVCPVIASGTRTARCAKDRAPASKAPLRCQPLLSDAGGRTISFYNASRILRAIIYRSLCGPVMTKGGCNGRQNRGEAIHHSRYSANAKWNEDRPP